MSGAVDDEETAIVIDNGSGCIKAGYSGDDTPRIVYQNAIGRPKLTVNLRSISNPRQTHFGDIAHQEISILTMNYPMDRGIVTNWEDMEEVWKHVFYHELRVDPKEHSVLITEPPFNPKYNREKAAEVLFEKFEALGVNVSLTPTMGLYASGRHCGVVADIGDGVLTVTPMKGVYCWPHAARRYHLGGRDLTNYLARLLNARGHYFQTSSEMQIVRDIKEKLGYVSPNLDEERKNYTNSSVSESAFELPDGKTINVGEEKCLCAEPIFNPALLGLEHPGISRLIYDTVMSIDIHMRRDMYCNILLAGAGTLFPGMVERVQKEIKELAPPSVKVKVVSHDYRQYYAWIGGSILASLSSFKDHVITRQQYEENGAAIIHSCIPW